MLDRVDVHCIWVSQAVLDLLPDPFPDVPGGDVFREPGMGVFCDNAMDLVRQYWPAPSKEKKRQFFKSAARELNKLGLVGMHDAGVIAEDLELMKELVKEPDWALRVYAMFECAKRNTFCPEEAVKVNDKKSMLTVRSVKLFAGTWSVT